VIFFSSRLYERDVFLGSISLHSAQIVADFVHPGRAATNSNAASAKASAEPQGLNA